MIEKLMDKLSQIIDEFEEAENNNDFYKMDKLKIEADEIRAMIDTELF